MVEISIITTLVGATVGAILGSYGTYMARERSRKNQKEERIENLRRSIVAERSSMDELANQKSSNYSTQIPTHRAVSAEVYPSNSSEISLLSPSEAEAVISFYSGALMLEQTLDTTRELVSKSEHPQMHDMNPLNESIDIIRNEWKTSVLTLISELDDHPAEISIDDKQFPVDESMSTADLWIVLNYWERKDGDGAFEFQGQL
jgi:gas vesicle protein